MKKSIVFLSVFFLSSAIYAQQIAVVSQGVATQTYTSLDEAIESAAAGSTIYLSGGNGFQIKDETKIDKKLTIIGIGHRSDNDNADGNTTITGNLNFVSGSNNSAVWGIYLGGNINIGNGDGAVNSMTVKFCNVGSIQVGNSECQGISINQSYIRNNSNGGGSTISFTNNVLHSIQNVNGGVIDHNVITSNAYYGPYSFSIYTLYNVSNSQIKNNILTGVFFYVGNYYIHTGNNSTVDNNMLVAEWGNNSVGVSNWEDEFEGSYSGVNTANNYHLKAGSGGKGKATDGTDIGIYGGSSFSDKSVPPGPRIVKKVIADRTDANGNLPVQIEVKVD